MILSDNSRVQSKDYGQIRFVLIYLIIITCLKFIFRLSSVSGFESIFSYLSVAIIFVLSISIAFTKKIVSPTEVFVSFIVLVSSFFFTALTGGFMSAVLAVGINGFLIYTAIAGNSIRITAEDMLRICKIVVIFALPILAYAFYNVGSIINILKLQNAYASNFVGIWTSKNQFGRFLFCVALCNFFVLIYNKRNGITKKIYYFTFFLISVSVVLTFSRAALLALLIFLTLYVLMTNKDNFKRNLLILIAVLLLTFVLYQNEFIRSAVEKLVIRSETADLESRSSLWKIGLDYFKSHVFIGAGEYRAAEILRAGGSSISEFHNAYVNRLVISGLPVFLLYAYLYLRRLTLLFKESKRNEYAVISFSVLVAIMTYMFFESFSLYTLSLDSYIIMTFIYLVPNLRMEE